MTGLFVCVAICAPALASAIDLSKPIKEIRIKGARRADENTVRFYIHSKPGERYDGEKAREDIKRIYNLGFFDDIKLDVEEGKSGGLVLTFIFEEKPFVREIKFTGVQELEKNIAHAKVKTKKGAFFRQDHIPWDKRRLLQAYRNKGYYFTEINVKVHKLPNNRVDVEYVVTEGRKILVSQVMFRGAEAFGPEKLQRYIETTPATWLSFINDSGAYKKDVLKTDSLRIESFYHDHGYIQAQIGDPEVEIDKEKQKIYISFPVNEGDQFRARDVKITGDDIYSAEELAEQISLNEGDIFNRSQLREGIFKITELYSRKGYAYANVIPDVVVDGESKEVDVNISVNPGPKVYIGSISITGNEKTRDRVIRREFLLSEGELFDSEKLRKTRIRINNLGFFEAVDFEQRSRREEDMVDLEVKVSERQTGQFSVAAGYSSIENLIFQTQIKWMSLLGRGQELSLTADMSSRRGDFSISFTEPSLFDRRVSVGVDLYNRLFVYDAFDSRNNGGSLRFGKGFGEYTWGKISYKYEENNLKILDRETASSYLLAQEGRRSTGSISPSITYDTRNDYYSPTAGNRMSALLEVAGVGGKEKFYKVTTEYSVYKSLLYEFVGMAHAKAGYIQGYDGKDVAVYERFFMGGPRSLRGFTIRDVGPLDENGEAIGGESLLLLNLELQYRFTKYFRGFLFYDRGNVYGEDDQLDNTTSKHFDVEKMRHSWGFGVHFFSPVGPISIIYGFKLDQRSGESPNEFHFTVGGAF